VLVALGCDLLRRVLVAAVEARGNHAARCEIAERRMGIREADSMEIAVRSNRKECEELLATTPAPNADAYHVCFPDTVDPRGPKGK
jgi:hypothetical protein